MSLVEILPDLPLSWAKVTLGDYIKFTKKSRSEISSKIAFVSMDLIPSGGKRFVGYKTIDKVDLRSGIYCEPGDILLSKITPCFENNKQGIVPDEEDTNWFATTEVFPIKTNEDKLSKEYLFWWLLIPDFRNSIAHKWKGLLEGNVYQERFWRI